MRRSLLPLLAVISGIGAAAAENWPAWRGESANGVVADSKGPQEFSAERSWKAKLEGRGCSTPVVWDGKVFVTGLIGKDDSVQAFDLKTGKELWRKTVGGAKLGRTQRIGSSANSSPITDGKFVYCYFKSGVLAALTPGGKVEWQISIDDFGKDEILWDRGTSPVFAGGNIVIAVMQQKGKSYLVSVRKKDGKKVWLTERPFKTKGETGDSYASPFVTKIDVVETIVMYGADHLTGHDAKSGKQLWVCGDFNKTNHGVWRQIASPVGTDGVAVVVFGREEFIGGIKMGGSGDITANAWLWRHKGWGSDTASPAAHAGKSLVLTDRGKERGTLTFVDVKTGDVLWQEKLPKSVHTFCASPTIVGETVYLSRQDGTVFAAQLTKTGLKNIRETKIEEGIIASPVVVDGRLLVRGDEHLVCFW